MLVLSSLNKVLVYFPNSPLIARIGIKAHSKNSYHSELILLHEHMVGSMEKHVEALEKVVQKLHQDSTSTKEEVLHCQKKMDDWFQILVVQNNN